jgi:tetratricopeptide (TPR) repeat protein
MALNTAVETRQIRIFISSTFLDMHDERDYLVTKIFPALRRYCEERDVSLYELDLRWGINEEESKQGKVVDICLKEIQKTTPFFIGLLGERYGWVPNEDERRKIAESTEVFEEYPWIHDELLKGTSITEIEIQDGVLRSQEKVNAYFYFRSPKMEVGEDFKENPGSREAQKLTALKKTLREQRDYPVKDYDSIEHLGNLVEEDFKALVDTLFPHGALSPLEKERLLQRVFLNRLTRVYVPNPRYDTLINGFVKSANGRAVAICGEAGIGKSALLAHWIQNRGVRENEKIIYHFVGQGEDEGDYRKITQRLIEEICDLYGLQSAQSSERQEGEEQKEAELRNLLDAVKDRGRLVIIMDGLDKLRDDNEKSAHLLEWLPDFSDNVRFICTTNKKSTISGKYNIHYTWKGRDTEVGAFDAERAKILIAEYLGSFGKKLTSSQIERIANDKENENPLTLITLLDELRMFGKYDELDGEIDRYLVAGNIPDLFALVLERLEKNYNYGKGNFVGDALSLIRVSQNGLSEAEICSLTGAKPLYWSQLYNGTANHLMVRNGLVTFSHNFIREAVERRYLSESAGIYEYRMKIADFMNDPLSMIPLNRKIGELIYQAGRIGSLDVLKTPEICLTAVQQDGMALEYVPVALRTAEVCLAAVKQNGKALEYVPVVLRTAEICLAAVQQDGKALEYLPEAFRTAEISLTAVQQDGKALEYVPEALQTPEICLTAVQQYGLALRHVPEALQTPEICLAAVRQWNLAITIVPEALRTPEICLAAMQRDFDYYFVFLYTPAEVLRTPEFYLAAMQKNGNALGYMSKALRTQEMCLAAVQQDGRALGFVPEALRTQEMCLTAVQQDDRALQFVPEALQPADFMNTPSACLEMISKDYSIIKFVPEAILTEEFCIDAIEVNAEVIKCLPVAMRTEKVCHSVIEANWIWSLKNPPPKIDSLDCCLGLVKRSGEAIMFVPGKYLTEELCCAAVEQNGGALEYVPEALQTPEICLTAVRQKSDALNYVPEALRTPEICLTAVRKEGWALEYVPEALQTPEICLTAVQQNGDALKHVPWALRTPEICFAAVQQNGKALKYVPDASRTPEICFAAVQQNGEALENIPAELRTPKMCLAAVQQNGLALKYVSDASRTPEICLAAVQQNGEALEYVFETLWRCKKFVRRFIFVIRLWRTILAAVQQNGLALRYVPEAMRLSNVCIAAVKQNGEALNYVPESLKAQVKKAAGIE